MQPSSDFGHSVDAFFEGQRKTLGFYSVWPQRKRLARILHRINFWHIFGFWIMGFNLSLLLKLVININQLDEMIRVFVVLATCIAYTFKVLAIKLNNKEMLELFGSCHSRHFLPMNIHEQTFFSEARGFSRKMRNYYAGISFTALNALLLTQYLIDNTQLPLATYSPLDVSKRSGYYAMYCYQCVALSLSCFVNISFDSLCSSLFIFVKCQLDMLALRLNSIGRHQEELKELQRGDQKQDQLVQQELISCILYYMRIVELAAKMERLLYKPISAQIFCSVLVLIANFYALSLLSDNYLVFAKFLTYQCCMLLQIFILCYYAGEISQRSLELKHELYKSNWVGWNKSNRKLMLLFMLRLENPIRIRTMNANRFIDVALFSSIVNSSYSYFALLKKVNS
ncbi:odorant receptor 46a [Scaptodrosophila lebanonensis]|uniref:Odorant receptor n=1 Tax=Drosophila lebanonensis TaxID=7225 RepID=A0A6J2UJM2_DROLE|nr:odorant receptor 46a [Scaptodrosophila lebanonensis]